MATGNNAGGLFYALENFINFFSKNRVVKNAFKSPYDEQGDKSNIIFTNWGCRHFFAFRYLFALVVTVNWEQEKKAKPTLLAELNKKEYGS